MSNKIICTNYLGNKYSIPEIYKKSFNRLDEDIENAEYNSKEQQDAIDIFNNEFADYERVT